MCFDEIKRSGELLVILIFLVIIAALPIGHLFFDFPKKGSSVTAIATAVLVLVTAFYAIQTYKTTKEMQKDRQKPGAILVVAAIDEIRYQLDRHIPEDSSEGDVPNIDDIQMPSEKFLKDIEGRLPNFNESLQRYVDIVMQYNKKRNKLKREISREILKNLSDELDELVEVHTSKEMLAGKFTEKILTGEIDAAYNEEWDEIEGEINAFENKMKISDDRTELFTEFQNILDLNRRLRRDLRNVREEFMSTYDLTELEVTEVQEDTSISKPHLLYKKF